jgi:hypothetical protein
VLAIASFLLNQTRHRAIALAFAPAIAFVGLSLFVNYMAAREEIRQSVWVQKADVFDRVQRLLPIFQNFELVDVSNPKHRYVIDGRLNQNPLVGLAAERLDFGQVGYSYGATFKDMFIGLIPRALWPEKPAVGGGASVVSDFTGSQFAEGTSVGAGQVLEFYVNFGTVGVIVGFFIYGLLIAMMDLRIIESLRAGDQRGYLLWFMLCLAMMQPGGNLVEITVTALGATIVAYVFSYFIRRMSHRQKQITKIPAQSGAH